MQTDTHNNTEHDEMISGARKPRAMTRASIFTAVGAFTLSLLGVAALPGCNTAAGIGEDLEAAGETISDEAEDAND